MSLKELYCVNNKNITDFGINKMSLKVLDCGYNKNITIKIEK
jgi:hypothetical protein